MEAGDDSADLPLLAKNCSSVASPNSVTTREESSTSIAVTITDRAAKQSAATAVLTMPCWASSNKVPSSGFYSSWEDSVG